MNPPLLKKCEEKPPLSPYNSSPLLQLSTVEYPFLPNTFLKVYEVLIILTMGYFIIDVSHVVVVRIILTNNHTKFLTQTSIGLTSLMDKLTTIELMDWNMSKRRIISFSIKFLYIYKFSYIYKFFNKSTNSKLLTRTWTIE